MIRMHATAYLDDWFSFGEKGELDLNVFVEGEEITFTVYAVKEGQTTDTVLATASTTLKGGSE